MRWLAYPRCHERAASARLRANRRNAGRHRTLHSAAAAGGVRGARFFALPGGRGGFSDGAAILAGRLSQIVPIASEHCEVLVGW